MNILILIGVAAIAAAVAIGVYIAVHRAILKGRKEDIIEKAELEAENIKKEKILQAKEKFLQLKSEHEKYINEKSNQILQTENKVKQKELILNQQNAELSKKQQEIEKIRENLNNQVQIVNRKSEEYDKLKKSVVETIENISGMSAEEAKAMLVQQMKDEAKTEAMSYINDVMDDARMNAAKEAKRIIINTIQRTAPETAIENAVTVFNIESDEIKGRIIGREGRNIRALEAATGVEIVVDDTPDAILLSAFDPVRREVARLALHQLVSDGRIHPARIEEVVAKVQKQLEEEILETGKRTCIDLGIHGLNIELVKLIGRMKYRSSYGQNLLQHSREVANICAIMAAELGLNPKLAKRAGLLHDIGKIGIPDYIINKAGKLTEEEYELIKNHPNIGADILSSITEMPGISFGAHWHHERFDGKGYPDGLAGEDIPEVARIICVADAYDTMTSKRVYRDILPQKVARDEILKGRGTQFDPVIADYMLEMIDEDTEYQLHE